MILTSLCKWGCTGVAPGLTGGARDTPGTPLAPPLNANHRVPRDWDNLKERGLHV